MSPTTRAPIAWTIAGSDSGGGAGIQADLKTFHDLGVHGCTAITALTAQNSTGVTHIEHGSIDSLRAQLQALKDDLPAAAIKIGMLADVGAIQCVADFLADFNGHVICDPVMRATSGAVLSEQGASQTLREQLIPRTSLITPNRAEVEILLGRKLSTHGDIPQAAKALLALGPQAVLITGGHFDAELGQRLDYYCDAQQQFWLAGESIATEHSHGSGCTLSSAIAAYLARGFAIEDALVLAKAYITAGLRDARPLGKGPGPIGHRADFLTLKNLPTLHREAVREAPQFPACEPLGLYPVVDSSDWIERLLPLGINTIQLRIKDKSEAELRTEIKRAVELGRQYKAQLFINDYWQLAIELGAYGVHLGQEDLDITDLNAIAEAGLRLGVSTHSYFEIARAHALRPSYIAMGPIFDTTTKVMKFGPQGLEQLQGWVELLKGHYPLTAIGGINLERAPKVLATGVESCAMVTAITLAENVEERVKALQALHK